ncbi:MAG: histidinol-phosphate transaminase [Ruminococcaceae bacterium]|nr:histidinol-phosphate transaminase [Oscillospiraceae bacterium]
MSKFFTARLAALTPYTPGEQPRDRKYIKLNTNESPFPPSPKAQKAAAEAAGSLQLYPDPTYLALHTAIADYHDLSTDEVLVTNGSDEILNFAFMAFCDENSPAVFPDITYGFYSVFATLNRVPYTEIPLRADFSLDKSAMMAQKGTLFIANPNAPTGLALSAAEIEEIVAANRDRVVVVDEAYVDFGGESVVPLVRKYDNLLVTRTFSKSRSMAGARLGYGVGSPSLIADLNTVKYSTNPYNVNSMSAAAGLGVMADEDYTQQNCATIIKNRESTQMALRDLGFEVTDSRGNFMFVRHPRLAGKAIYSALRARGILVRHFSKAPIADYNRITVGTAEEMAALVAALADIIKE